MTLTNAQIELIRDSFHRLAPKIETASTLFYDRLFEIAPELRALFRSDLDGQGMRFMGTLDVIVKHLDDPIALQPYVQRLAEGHAAYGVKPEHFRPMGKALIQTMQETLGVSFPEGADAAWTMAYDYLAREMVRSTG